MLTFFNYMGTMANLCHKFANVCTSHSFMTKIWNKTDDGSKTLDVHLHNLRRKIQPMGLKIVHRLPYEYFLASD
jgi:DNA-binding response OmpR family regulator